MSSRAIFRATCYRRLYGCIKKGRFSENGLLIVRENEAMLPFVDGDSKESVR